eukprot:TRINITY_DN51503_c0_g1_i1.p1 TRINITY_DN51503_c0_g1~~TRINITY_DN51503_c0_g1_i1.p1  ORF type:complete len:348 (+),score=31.38 TRINITY_DN51503_c0_g1_i1:95-1138(+)
MCFPPFCQPARRFLGCLSLRFGAVFALVMNAAYGLVLVVIHALLLGKQEDIVTTTRAPGVPVPAVPAGATPKEGLHDNVWFLQLLDLDLSFGHKLLGNNDFTCLLFGLIYGIIILVACGYMVQQVQHGGPHVAVSSRWFVAFMNLEIVIYIGLVLCKFPIVCFLDENFLTRLEMDCDLQRFLYVQRVVVYLVVAGICCWTFSSLAYFLAFGVDAINRPDFADHLDLHDAQTNVAGGEQSNGLLPSMNFFRSAGRPQSQGYHVTSRVPVQSGRLPVGEAVSVAPHSMSQLPMTTRGSLQPQSRVSLAGSPQRTSYHIPRASSSMATTMTTHSQAAETHALIKPPVAIY